MVEKLKFSVSLLKQTIITLFKRPILLLYPAIGGLAIITIMFGVYAYGCSYFGLTLAESDTFLEMVLGLDGESSHCVFGILYFIFGVITVSLTGGFVYFSMTHYLLNIFKEEKKNCLTSFVYSVSHLRQIIFFSMIQATISLVSARTKKIGNFPLSKVVAASLGAFTWEILSLFVIPTVVDQDISVMEGFETSVKILKKKFGESIISLYGLGTALRLTSLLVIPGILLLGTIIFMATQKLYIVPTMGFAVLLYLLLLALVYPCLKAILSSALYFYVVEGRMPSVSYTTKTYDRILMVTP